MDCDIVCVLAVYTVLAFMVYTVYVHVHMCILTCILAFDVEISSVNLMLAFP